MTKALLLLSGGFDSPVAGYLLQRKGYLIAAVHFSFAPLTDNEPEEKSRKLAALLGFAPFTTVTLAGELKAIAEHADPRLYFVLMKRLMIRKAEEVAGREGCSRLVTGESLGQVSSQTLENLRAIDAAATLPVIRPLIAMDKQEIIAIAERIGTFEISKGKEMCDVLGPERPTTRARLEDILQAEQSLSRRSAFAHPKTHP